MKLAYLRRYRGCSGCIIYTDSEGLDIITDPSIIELVKKHSGISNLFDLRDWSEFVVKLSVGGKLICEHIDEDRDIDFKLEVLITKEILGSLNDNEIIYDVENFIKKNQ